MITLNINGEVNPPLLTIVSFDLAGYGVLVPIVLVVVGGDQVLLRPGVVSVVLLPASLLLHLPQRVLGVDRGSVAGAAGAPLTELVSCHARPSEAQAGHLLVK